MGQLGQLFLFNAIVVPALLVSQVHSPKAFVKLAGGIPFQNVELQSWTFQRHSSGRYLQENTFPSAAFSVLWSDVYVLHKKVATLPGGVRLITDRIPNGLSGKIKNASVKWSEDKYWPSQMNYCLDRQVEHNYPPYQLLVLLTWWHCQ